MYDFDKTLSTKDMQEYGFMKALETNPQTFWSESDRVAEDQNADKNLSYMLTMLREAQKKGIFFTKDKLKTFGKDIPLFDGVNDWFSRINEFALKNGIELQHYLLSSGLKEIVAGLPISNEFTKVYACSFMYDKNGVAFWPAQVVNYTTKTQYLFRISKGCLGENDASVNDRTPKSQRSIPFSQMLYIGDGLTDVPCMATLRRFGGQALAVFNTEKDKSIKGATKLLEDGRVDHIAPTDYRDGSRIDELVKAWLKKIKSDNVTI